MTQQSKVYKATLKNSYKYALLQIERFGLVQIVPAMSECVSEKLKADGFVEWSSTTSTPFGNYTNTYIGFRNPNENIGKRT